MLNLSSFPPPATCQWKSNREAAGTLEVSTRTVESHRDHIMHKLQFSSFSQLVRFAVRTKLVEP